MKYYKYFGTTLLSISFGFVPAFMLTAHSQTNNNTDYGSLNEIVPIITTYKKSPPTLMVPIGLNPTPAPVIPNPTYPIPITSTPAPGKFAMVRWLLPGGPPPPAPNLPPLECTINTCPND
jgi:hypothetical protein